MPWSPDQANKFKKGLGPDAKQRWAKIANKVLQQSGNEGQAIRIANGATRGSTAIDRRLKRGKP